MDNSLTGKKNPIPSFFPFKTNEPKNIQRYIYWMSFSFQTIANITVSGYMQAVSDDGKAIVYRSQDTIYLYYFDGKKITTRNFSLPFTLPQPDEFYTEEHAFHHTIVKVFGNRILIYMNISQLLFMIEFPDYRYQEVIYKDSRVESEVFDIGVHPGDHSLIVFLQKGLLFLFMRNQTLVQFSVESESETIKAKLYAHEEGDLITYYLFYLQDEEVPRLHLYKAREPGEEHLYQITHYHRIEFDVGYDFDILSDVDYDERNQIFVLTKDHANETEGFRAQGRAYLDKDLQAYEGVGEDFNLWFHSFLKGDKNELIFGNIFLWTPHNFFLQQICVVPYSVEENTITFDSEGKKCEEGFYDRVSSWEMNGETYLLTHIDRSLTIQPNIDEKEIAILEATSFSTKYPDILILEQYGELIFTEYRQNPDDDKKCEGCLEVDVPIFVIILVVLGIFVVLTIILSIRLYRKKPNVLGENIKPNSVSDFSKTSEKIDSQAL